ncbi:TetR/AcrR family transcriptional regulator [Emticicia sp. BO119]|uniref:TetR/AcrR family transcriptional regulator n=1 Tax=Emticicia sp. BO119 TaxID=2757768 RepID=UPI0015F05487|nr:TetR/AcrR family transcriptional regulator [Emticicia sp. BO119]MBA4853408.1 TetR/AcrR family transcriptional regulator [Emticicia sp. BO119]
MEYQLNFRVNNNIYIRDPESSELGKEIVRKAIELIYEIGYEHFTFKKLATEVGTTEASIYRYFKNKHFLLVYILNWYWSYLEFLVMFQLKNINDPQLKIRKVIELLTRELPTDSGRIKYNISFLNQIVITESSKVYLVKEIKEINQAEVFKQFKDLCNTISTIVLELNPQYPYPHSLSSTLIETSHNQQFFSSNLKRLTDVKTNEDVSGYVAAYLEDLVFRVLK